MMGILGFHDDFISQVMACVNSVKYKVRFKGQETYMFTSTRGHRQGDSLSPYLFLLCVESLSSAQDHKEEVPDIEGMTV